MVLVVALTPRSALKDDKYHVATSFVVDDPAAQRVPLLGGDGASYDLYQLAGEIDGKPGVFEWVVDSGGDNPVITHQMFRVGGSVTGTMP